MRYKCKYFSCQRRSKCLRANSGKELLNRFGTSAIRHTASGHALRLPDRQLLARKTVEKPMLEISTAELGDRSTTTKLSNEIHECHSDLSPMAFLVTMITVRANVLIFQILTNDCSNESEDLVALHELHERCVYTWSRSKFGKLRTSSNECS